MVFYQDPKKEEAPGKFVMLTLPWLPHLKIILTSWMIPFYREHHCPNRRGTDQLAKSRAGIPSFLSFLSPSTPPARSPTSPPLDALL